MTAQEVFDTAVCGVIRQGGPSLNSEGVPSCLYRGFMNETRCAVGFLIDDKDADIVGGMDWIKAIEHISVPRLAGHTMLIQDLQNCHDAHTTVSDKHEFMARFVVSARACASEHNLSTEAMEAALCESK